jgi:hypothetical protein
MGRKLSPGTFFPFSVAPGLRRKVIAPGKIKEESKHEISKPNSHSNPY